MYLKYRVFLTILFTLVLCVSFGECQRKNKWRKQKNSRKDCNLKSLEKCFNDVDEKNKQSARHLLLKTSDGLDEICR